jgi:methyl-accepting chemotaxis protein
MIEASTRRADTGVDIAQRVGSALEEIVAGTNKVNSLLAEINSASNEQATGIRQVNGGVVQLEQVTQANAGNSEELASSAEEMSSQVAAMRELVAQFKVSASAAPSTPPGRPVAKAERKAAGPTAAGRGAPNKRQVLSSAARRSSPEPAAASAIPLDDSEVLASF